MIALFQKTFNLNIAILTNSIIYRLRQLPLIKHAVPGELYGNEGINAFIIVLTIFFKIGKAILGQLLYLLMILIPISFMYTDFDPYLIIVFLIFPLFSAFHYNKTFYASKEKYYAIVLMRIDANQYGIMDFIKYVIKNTITSFVLLLILWLFFKYPIYYSILYPIFYFSFKTISTYLLLKKYEQKKVLYTDKSILIYISMILMFVTTLALFSCINQGWITIPNYIYFIIAGLSLIIALFAYQKITHTHAFNGIYKKKLTLSAMMLDVDVSTVAIKKSVTKGLNSNIVVNTNKKGFDFFNTVFFRRHKKLLLDSSIKFALGYALVLSVAIIAISLFPKSHAQAYEVIQYRLPYLLMLMYFTNRGAKVTMAMFVNCDSSMLHYRFYKQPKVILSLFTQRLRTVILVNLLPSMVLALGLSFLLFVCKNDAPFVQYFIIFLAINAISIFFSVHHLVLYYLLQPYTENLQAKGYLFNIINSITYFVCYYLMGASINLFPFTIIATSFCILYVLVALVLVYRMAPKTFRIKN